MAQPTWTTPAGSIGTFTEQVPVNFTFAATPEAGHTLSYQLLNGEFPPGNSTMTNFSLSSSGVLTGTPAQVAVDTEYKFSIRLLQYLGPALVSFSDRTFSMSVTGSTLPSFTTPAGALYPGPTYLPDSTWNPIQIGISNPDPGITYSVSLDTGLLPPGLEINSQGLIRGYADAPVAASQTYTFTLKVTNVTGYALRTFSITVVNQDSIPSLRTPTILNTRPLTFEIDPNDEYAPYYVPSTTNGLQAQVGLFCQNNYFIFKINGYAFTGNPVTYNIISGTLPPGLYMDTVTGWITGTITVNPLVVETYSAVIRVHDTGNLQYSANFTFNIVVVDETNNVPVDITVNWLTASDLGTMNNGDVSTKFVQALTNSGQALTYTIVSGALPPNLQFLSNGTIVGRVAFQTQGTVTAPGTTLPYTFTVTASNPTYPEITATRTFNLNVYQKFNTPYENLYMTALLDTEQRSILDSFLADTTLIPNQYIYRPTDPYFGKATDIKYMHFFGIETSSLADFQAAITENYYWRDITLGPVKTAVARNNDNEIIYEVVYSEIIDDLINPAGQSISSSVVWPQPINGITTTVYPASLPNMQTRLTDSITNLNVDGSVLPSWMTSQQPDGSTLGFVKAWVICYAMPGRAETIRKNLTQTQGTLPLTVVKTVNIENELYLDSLLSTDSLYINMPVTFTGTTFGNVLTATTYYVQSITGNLSFKISTTIDGTPITLTTAVGSMVLVPSATLTYTLNKYQFKLDRFTVDNSLTYNYNPSAIPPASPWLALPSVGTVTDNQDFDVFFPKQNILD